jgi:glyoxylase-like metal-dependent hydrolase (beta-lactamase superfamily II)
MKTKAKIILGSVIAFVVFLAILMGPILARMPFAQASRIEDGTLVGIDAGGSFSWVIPTASGVVLVDAGWDTEAKQILDEVGDRKILAVLMTHGHFDHTSGLLAFPDVPVYVGPGEEALLRGQVEPKGWMALMSTRMMSPTAPTPQTVIEFVDGQEIKIDGIAIRAVHTPGHTGGSAMYIWNNTLFSGDSIVGRGDHVNEIPRPTADNYDQIKLSVAKVLDYQFERMADGHVGLHKEIRTQVETYVNR